MGELRRTSRGHGCIAIQELYTDPALCEIRFGQVRQAENWSNCRLERRVIRRHGGSERSEKYRRSTQQARRKLDTENDMVRLSNPDNHFLNEDRLGKGNAMVDTPSALIGIFENLDLGKNRTDGDDLLGDAYEYLMRHFATESDKSKGQFYTPSEVLRFLSKILGISKETRQDKAIYDPTCCSGSLLLKVNDEAPNGFTLYGQEKDNTTADLAKMNMILHDVPSADTWHDDSLSEPHWLNNDGCLKTFDFLVVNPPFSYKSWSSGLNVSEDPFKRFEYGTSLEKNGDYAFLLHINMSLKSTGKGVVILPHGILFRVNVGADIRRNSVRQGYIKGIIGLPPNLFYGTGIPACIIALDKEGVKAERPIFMIDASKGFMKDGNKNRLRAQDIHKIVDVFNKQLEIEQYARLVPCEEIAGKNEFNLNIPRYITNENVRLAVVSRLPWIKKRQGEIRKQPRQTSREYVSSESHYYQGRRYILDVVERHGKHSLSVKNTGKMLLQVSPGTSIANRVLVFTNWYQQQFKNAITSLLDKWQPIVGKDVHSWGVKKMKTKWGSCNIEDHRIWLNLELTKKSPEVLEYIFVHELVHLHERHHNDNFRRLMDKFLPHWRQSREVLNNEPLAHEDWQY